jgi:signal recognition particle receptor subunit alpha
MRDIYCAMLTTFQIGTLVSMVHASGTPVLFVGVGQHYSDIRSLNVKWAVDKLLSPV